jgi:hypothetical protein
MRFFITNLLATAMVVFAAGSASAISLTLAGANGQLVAVGGQVSVTVTLDTEATTGLVLLSTGVLFDDAILSYNSGASSSPTYILYVNGKTPYMQPASNPPELRFGTTNQVNVDWVATNLTTGSGGTGVELLATLVFDVIGDGDGTADIGLSITSPGNIVQLAGGVDTTATLNGAGTVITPEPTTALLVGLGLLGLGVAGRRRE